MAKGGSECQMLPKLPFIDQSLQYESGLTSLGSILVGIMHSDVMTHYSFTGGFGVFHAQVKQTKGLVLEIRTLLMEADTVHDR